MDPTRSRRAQLIREAEGYVELGMYEYALRTLDRLGSGDELESHAAYLRGEALRSQERYREAADALEHACEATPDDIHIWLALGWCYKRLGQMDRAIRALEEALEIEPGEALIHYNLACYWSLAGGAQRAIHYLAAAFDIDSNYRDMVEDEPDFDPIRDDPGFLNVTSVIV